MTKEAKSWKKTFLKQLKIYTGTENCMIKNYQSSCFLVENDMKIMKKEKTIHIYICVCFLTEQGRLNFLVCSMKKTEMHPRLKNNCTYVQYTRKMYSTEMPREDFSVQNNLRTQGRKQCVFMYQRIKTTKMDVYSKNRTANETFNLTNHISYKKGLLKS